MTADGTAQASGQAGRAGQDYRGGFGFGLTRRSLLFGRAVAPLWMLAEVVRLRTAFPEFSFGICPGWHGLRFQAWRAPGPGPGGLCAVITQDAGELWHELAASQQAG
jgi:hypothetical protein